MHVFLTGKPASGKTTLIKSVLSNFVDARGFYTEQIVEGGKRVGFKLVTLKGKEAIFAHKDFDSPFMVSSYKIDLDTFEKIAVEELKLALNSNCKLVVIDEIGKMEVLSEKFCSVCLEILDVKKVLGTISLAQHPFIDQIKKRKDIYLIELEPQRLREIEEEILLATSALSSEEIRLLEKKAINLGLNERILIENASTALSEEVQKIFEGKNILVVAGRGNNGADSLACARKLLGSYYDIKVVIVASGELNEEVLFQKNILARLGVDLCVIQQTEDLKKLEKLLDWSDCVIDGILGIGMNKEPSGIIRETIKIINEHKKFVVACDIPTGLHVDFGAIFKDIIKADYTISFIAAKEGFFLGGGRNFCGRIAIKDIGISRKVLEDLKTS